MDPFEEYKTLVSDLVLDIYINHNEPMFDILNRTCKAEIQLLVDDKILGILNYIRSKYQVSIEEAEALHKDLLDEMAEEYMCRLITKDAKKQQEKQDIRPLSDLVIAMTQTDVSTIKH